MCIKIHKLHIYKNISDGTLLPIWTPKFAKSKAEKEKFFCRKKFSAWNGIAVCDHNKKFTYLSVKHYGSINDSVAYNTSYLKVKLLEQFNPKKPRYLVSDEGINNQKTMFIPFRRDRVKSRAEKLYNRQLKKFRVYIEHCFGMWKMMFPILLDELR